MTSYRQEMEEGTMTLYTLRPGLTTEESVRKINSEWIAGAYVVGLDDTGKPIGLTIDVVSARTILHAAESSQKQWEEDNQEE